MNLSARENYLRTIEFSNPQWIPCSVSFSLATWLTQEKELAAIMAEHPLLFGQVKPRKTDLEHLPPVYKPGYFKDNWGCLWHNKIAGLEGMIVDHPLADWAAFDTYAPPDFNLYSERGTRDWAAIEADFAWKRKQGELTIGDGERLFDRLYFLRGFENLLMDIAEDHPRLPLLIEMLWQYEMGLIKKWLEIGVDALSFHTDIGTQRSLMISPAHFRKYLKPMFKDLFMTVRKAGAHVLLSSDGVLLEIVDD